jgi:SNF2 family DNA or RNA helicase
MHVLEALLRLRQAACDPRLIDPKSKVKGAKLPMLMEQLEELTAEGHKALVFSQFTSLLALLRRDVDAKGWNYEYLDGKTRKRNEPVQRFQEDPNCNLFLISLKAGGHGLNLTAADYVFILDPWWNPAVEAQAIDRAHRMGQTKSVNAYRMICRDTVEEKIVDLQTSKRKLADAIISQKQSLISELTSDDLRMLFE